MRVPSPAANTMARRGTVAWAVVEQFFDNVPPRMKSDLIQSRNVFAVPGTQRCECRMGQRSLQIVPYTRHMSQILRFAIAHVEARKDAENFAGALGGQGH